MSTFRDSERSWSVLRVCSHTERESGTCGAGRKSGVGSECWKTYSHSRRKQLNTNTLCTKHVKCSCLPSGEICSVGRFVVLFILRIENRKNMR